MYTEIICCEYFLELLLIFGAIFRLSESNRNNVICYEIMAPT